MLYPRTFSTDLNVLFCKKGTSYTPCGSPEEGNTEGKALSGHAERVERQEQYSPVISISITCIDQGPEHRRGFIPFPFTTQVSCPGILQVNLIKSVEKVRGYNSPVVDDCFLKRL